MPQYLFSATCKQQMVTKMRQKTVNTKRFQHDRRLFWRFPWTLCVQPVSGHCWLHCLKCAFSTQHIRICTDVQGTSTNAHAGTCPGRPRVHARPHSSSPHRASLKPPVTQINGALRSSPNNPGLLSFPRPDTEAGRRARGQREHMAELAGPSVPRWETPRLVLAAAWCHRLTVGLWICSAFSNFLKVLVLPDMRAEWLRLHDALCDWMWHRTG